MAQTVTTHVKDIHRNNFMRQYSQLFCLGLQIWISEMLQYYPELEVVELVQDGQGIFWDHQKFCTFRAEKYLPVSQDNGHYKLSNAQ
jgi:hypothetical protein